VPEGKVAKNRVHLDLNVGGGHGTPLEDRKKAVDAQVDRLRGEGATVVRPVEQHDEYWVVMQDPEGNEFCLQ
jgi:predicted enzyme related to lactoylglutathione lyase